MISNHPYILNETDDFAVVYKPPQMHTAPLQEKTGGTLTDWYLENNKGDLMHRLDFETHGLVLFAKNKKSFDFFNSLQDSGEFVKEYSAVCENTQTPAAGFPPAPVFTSFEASKEKPLIISSYFRPFGPGRKEVRPVFDDGKKHHEIAKDNGGFYRTEVINVNENVFTVRIRRGFRHQIRCHLCWIGFPITGDELYNLEEKKKEEEKNFTQAANAANLKSKGAEDAKEEEERDEGKMEGALMLRAQGLFFADPVSGERLEFRIESL